MYNPDDYYSRKARQQGYAARSVFKLSEMQQRWRLIGKHSRVLELGAAPGSWSRYILRQFGANGQLIAVDLQPLSVSDSRLQFYQGDFTSAEFSQWLAGQRGFDLLLSDAAPATSGQKSIDRTRSALLVEQVIDISATSLHPGGSLVVKIFDSAETPTIRKRLQHGFQRCHSLRPQAVRKSSTEIYLIAIGKEQLG